MKKIITLALVAVMSLGITGCTQELNATTLVDGTYRAEFREYDCNGWKDYVEVTIAEGQLDEVVYDAVKEGSDVLKSEDESYKNEMEAIVGTYPAKYNKDLINQFIESGKVTAVDIVAGATESTGNFKTLVIAVMESAAAGETETHIVENLKK